MVAEADDIFQSFNLLDDDKKKYETVKAKFKSHFVKRRNVIYERATFNKRKHEEGETVDSFITALYSLSEHCGYGVLREEMIRDRIVIGIQDAALSLKLQLMEKLTLDQALTKVREVEAIKSQQPLLRSDMKDTKSGTTVNVSAVHKRGPGNKRSAHKPLSNSKLVCFRCGRSPPHDRQQCPAKDVVCHKCSKRDHFKAICKTNKKIGGVHEEPQTTGTNEYDSDECFLGVVGTDGSNPWPVILQLNGTPTEFQIDTGAKASIISEQIYKDIGSPSLLQHRCLGGQTRVSFPLWDNLQETQEQQY